MSTLAVKTTPNQQASTRFVSLCGLRRFFSGIDVEISKPRKNVAHPVSPAPLNVSATAKFFSIIRREIEPCQRKLEKRQAPQFNTFDFIRPDENKLSDILAWLLDPVESHGQGDLFLWVLLKRVGFLGEYGAHSIVRVKREAPTFGIEKYRRRLDILVQAGAWLAIENKLDSPEQRDQVKDYLEHLRVRSQSKFLKTALIYLTPDGRPPESLTLEERRKFERCGHLQCWKYQKELSEWLEDCWTLCEAQRIKLFLMDFLNYIQSSISPQKLRTFEDMQHE